LGHGGISPGVDLFISRRAPTHYFGSMLEVSSRLEERLQLTLRLVEPRWSPKSQTSPLVPMPLPVRTPMRVVPARVGQCQNPAL
jgi:hypothetical protein